jgi:hypothetical protein
MNFHLPKEVRMFSRIRIAVGLALLFALFTSVAVLAKGSFAFIRVTGPDLKETVQISDPALTADFFTFADFFQNQTEVPADPGAGYEITRYYADGGSEAVFDKLHYYPDLGLVYYDGIVNGSSEYDGKWYTAKPDVKTIFENTLSNQIRLMSLGSEEASKMLVPPPQASRVFPQSQLNLLIAATAVLAMIFGFVIWRRKSSVR